MSRLLNIKESFDMKNNRNQKLARRLALWSIADRIDDKLLNDISEEFSEKCTENLKEIKEIKKDIYKLQQKENEIIKQMMQKFNESVISLIDKTEDKMAKSLVNIAFWSKIQEKDNDLYKVLHPKLEEDEIKE